MEKIFKFLGGRIVSHPSSKRQSSPELYLEWQFPEPYTKYNHPIWRNLHLEDDWNFLHDIYHKLKEDFRNDKFEVFDYDLWRYIEESLVLNNKTAFIYNFTKFLNKQTNK